MPVRAPGSCAVVLCDGCWGSGWLSLNLLGLNFLVEMSRWMFAVDLSLLPQRGSLCWRQQLPAKHIRLKFQHRANARQSFYFYHLAFSFFKSRRSRSWKVRRND